VAVLTIGAAVAVLAYLPTLGAGFVFDDKFNIVDQAGVHWTAISWDRIRGLFTDTLLPRRFAANLSFALNHLVGGLDPTGYHLVNVLIHLGVGLALAMLVLEYLRQSRDSTADGRLAPTAAAVAAVVFLLHPLNTQAVAYVVQRMASLAALFTILAFWAYMVGRRRATRRVRWFMLAGALWLVGVSTKENAAMLPIVLLTYEVCFSRGEWMMAWRQARPDRRIRILLAGGAALVATAAILAVFSKGYTFPLTLTWDHRDFNGIERMLTQARVQFLYLGLLLWPTPGRLNLDHHVAVSRSLVDPVTTLLAILAWMGIAACAVLIARRRPAIGFPVIAYMEFHLIEAGPVNLELMFEHRMYLPLTMLAVLLGVGLTRVPVPRFRIAVGAVLLASLPLAAWTFRRVGAWVDPVEFAYDVARKSPHKYRPQYNLGTELAIRQRSAEAIKALERAVELDPTRSFAHNQLGNAYYDSGQLEAALPHYRRAVELDIRNAEALFNLALVLDRLGETRQALVYYERFLRIEWRPSMQRQVEYARMRLGALS
jgi:hypothetical protein